MPTLTAFGKATVAVAPPAEENREEPTMSARTSIAVSIAAVGIASVGLFATPGDAGSEQGIAVAPGLVLPKMDPENGKFLFASKGCVVCHQVNGVGGTDAASLDAKTMDPVMSPFDFFAKMWLGAQPMIEMQNSELGGQIQLTGQDLADLVAFVHNAAAQRTFSEADIPENIRKLMQRDEDSGGTGMKMGPAGGGMIMK